MMQLQQGVLCTRTDGGFGEVSGGPVRHLAREVLGVCVRKGLLEKLAREPRFL